MKDKFTKNFHFELPAWGNSILILSVLILIAALAACGPPAEQVPENSAAGQESAPTAENSDAPIVGEEMPAYPGSDAYPSFQSTTSVDAQESYPAETLPPPSPTTAPDVYPSPTEEEVFAEPRILLDLPVSVGDTVVTGQAPVGLALAAIDVTYNGAVLGQGKTDADGRFSINVNNLVEGNRLGLTFAELEPGLSIAEMSIKYYPHRGDGFRNIPNVGVILDSTLIEP